MFKTLFFFFFRCDVCCEDIPTNQRTQHKNQHKTETQFGRGLQKGRVTKHKNVDEQKKTTEKKTTEKKKKSGYLKFCATMRPVLRERHRPTPKDMMALLGMSCTTSIIMFVTLFDFI